ncbi:Hsp70 family protein [Glycomyces arizonensis]|uniref:Hsp70 family protein n=1 Tax=Glycomyces arizonensis TaxID=256035 RepID=UPI0004023605|nr:Hsp70 family protein [Glycomyces arizonensis]
MSPSSYLLSVDLGTSHTVAMLRWPDGRTRPLLFDGQPILPVGVFRDEAGGLVVGRDAARLSTAAPDRFEPHPKRHIGHGSVLLGNEEVSVEAMFAAVLRRVAAVCAEITGALPETVVTCPSTWSARRREVLASAAAKAGFPPVTVVTEPVAAAHYYQAVLDRPVDADEALAVVDVGAGTVDIAVLARDGERLSIVAEGGLDDLGGVDIDAAIVEHLRRTAGSDHHDAWTALEHPETTEHGRNRRSLWSEAREAKEMLSRTAVSPVAIPGVEAGLHLTRPELDALARPLLEPMIRELKRLKAAVESDGHRLGNVFLVGGASRMPLVANMIHSELGIAPVGVEQPELAVAEGAATPGVPTADTHEIASDTITVAAEEPTSVLPPHTGPPRRRFLAVVSSAVAVTVAAAAALIWFFTELPGGAEPGPSSAVITADEDQVCLEDAELLESAPAVLRGPHFELHVSCVALFDADQAHLLTELLGEELDVSGSERVMVAHFPAEGRRFELPEDSAHTVLTEIGFGSGEWETDGIPEGDTAYVAVVDGDVAEDEAAATVGVTDAERTQTLDLRTGEIADQIAAYYHGVFGESTNNLHLEMELASQDDYWTSSSWFDIDFVATRSVFDEERGYLCAPELALVTVEFAYLMEVTAYEMTWPYDPAKQLWINTDTGTIAPKDVEHRDEQRDSDQPGEAGIARYFTVDFAVPAELTAFQIVFEPPAEVYDSKNDVQFYATTGDETRYLDFEFEE